MAQRELVPVDDTKPKTEQAWEGLYAQLLERHQRMHQAEVTIAVLNTQIADLKARRADDESLYRIRGLNEAALFEANKKLQLSLNLLRQSLRKLVAGWRLEAKRASGPAGRIASFQADKLSALLKERLHE